MALSEACKETIWLRKLVQEVVGDLDTATIMYEDNQAVLSVSGGLVSWNNKKQKDRSVVYS